MKSLLKNTTALIFIVALIGGVLGFVGGMKYQESHALSFQGQGSTGQDVSFGGRNGKGKVRFGKNGRQGGGNITAGEVLSVDADGFTIKLPDGSSKIVNLSTTTTYTKSGSGSKADLKVGETVAAFGSENSDGSISADSVQLNPQMRLDRRGGRRE